MQVFRSRQQGFGLIEIMVVVAIIGILGGVSTTATQHMRGKAKAAKAAQEIHAIESMLDVYESTAGGYPNPDPGQRKVYCVGSVDCSFRGKAVSAELPGEGMPVFDELLAFGDTQGYMYMSCGDEALICDSADTALLYGLDGDLIDPFGDDLGAFVYDDFEWENWEWEEIDWGIYPDYIEDEDEEGNGYVCAPPEYPEGSFEAYPSPSSGLPVVRSPDCTFDPILDQYNCTNDCVNATTFFMEYMVYAQYPYPYQHSCQEEPPRVCLDVMGTKYCDYLCD